MFYWLTDEFYQLGKYFIIRDYVAKILMISDFQIPDPGPPDNHHLIWEEKE